jgi:hypothetical protein
MSLVEQVTDAAGNVLAPIAENTVARIVDGLRAVVKEELIGKLSGKKIVLTIEIPDLTK